MSTTTKTTKSGLQVGSAGKQPFVDGEEAQSDLSIDARPFWLRHPLVALFCVALVVRGAVAILLTNYFSGSLVLDDQTYWAIARDLVYGLTSEWDAYEGGLYAQTRAFSLPLAGVYGVSGGNELAGQLLVALLGSGVCIIVYLLARRMIGDRLAFFPALLVAVLPSQVLWSSLILKDAFVWFALASIALIFIRHARAVDRSALITWSVGLAAALLFLAFLRPHTTVVATWALLLVCWVGSSHQRRFRVASVVLVTVAIPWLSGLGPAGASFAMNATPVSEIREANAAGAESAIITPPADLLPTRPEVEAHIENVQMLETQKERLSQQIKVAVKVTEKVAVKVTENENFRELRPREKARAQAQLTRLQERLETVTALLAAEKAAIQEGVVARTQLPSDPTREVGVPYVARGISVMLAEPYPWNRSTSPAFTMAKFEMILWYPTLALATLGLYVSLRRHRDVMALPVIMGAGIMLMYALTEGNVGTAFRHRGEFVWVVALLAGIGVATLFTRKSRSV